MAAIPKSEMMQRLRERREAEGLKQRTIYASDEQFSEVKKLLKRLQKKGRYETGAPASPPGPRRSRRQAG
jgi:hypothetical protein